LVHPNASAAPARRYQQTGLQLLNRDRLLLIGLVGSILLVLVALQMSSASYVDGQYLPVGHDAFYHGSRILDAVRTGSVPQFDARMHSPTGDWVTWPWAYDALLGAVTRSGHALFGLDPMAVAVHIPPVLGVLGVALLLAVVAGLGLSVGLAFIAVLCFALHAYTQFQFGVGALDHHGAEQLAVLALLALGVTWMQRPESRGLASSVGLCLGLSLGVHASLVVLQLPVLVALLLSWLRHENLSMRAAMAFASGLIVGALAILLPAQTFWQARFDLYYLSWLQFYCSLVTAGILLATSRWQSSPRVLAGFVLVGCVLVVPLIATIRFSASFLTGDLPAIAQIDEIRSPFSIAADPLGVRRISQVYTLLVWITPILLLAALGMSVSERDRARRYFWVWSAFGLALLMLQLRLGGLGVVFLYLPLLVLASKFTASRPHAARGVTAAIVVTLLIAYAPTLRYQLVGARVPAMDEQFATLRPILPALAEICSRQPGVVLATPGDGHLVRYFTDCSVVSNNFRLTPTDLERISTSLRLIEGPADKLRQDAPYVMYVLARLIAPAESADPVLFSELLNPAGDLPEGFRTLVEAGVTQPDGTRYDYLGVFAVATQSPTS